MLAYNMVLTYKVNKSAVNAANYAKSRKTAKIWLIAVSICFFTAILYGQWISFQLRTVTNDALPPPAPCVVTKGLNGRFDIVEPCDSASDSTQDI
jgi:hypothetical protein